MAFSKAILKFCTANKLFIYLLLQNLLGLLVNFTYTGHITPCSLVGLSALVQVSTVTFTLFDSSVP